MGAMPVPDNGFVNLPNKLGLSTAALAKRYVKSIDGQSVTPARSNTLSCPRNPLTGSSSLREVRVRFALSVRCKEYRRKLCAGPHCRGADKTMSRRQRDLGHNSKHWSIVRRSVGVPVRERQRLCTSVGPIGACSPNKDRGMHGLISETDSGADEIAHLMKVAR